MTYTAKYKFYTYEWDVKCAKEEDLQNLKLVGSEVQTIDGKENTRTIQRTPGQGLFRVVSLKDAKNGATHRLIFLDGPGGGFPANVDSVLEFVATLKIEGLDKSEMKAKITINAKKGEGIVISGPEILNK